MSGTPLLRTLMMVAAPVIVLSVCAVVVLVDVRSAMYVLAGCLLVLGAVRLCAPAPAGIAVRSRTFDVVLLVGLALAIALLAPWGNAALPTPA